MITVFHDLCQLWPLCNSAGALSKAPQNLRIVKGAAAFLQQLPGFLSEPDSSGPKWITAVPASRGSQRVQPPDGRSVHGTVSRKHN